MSAPSTQPQEDVTQAGYWSAWLTLFTSASTLICCALPALLVTLGAGAVLSSLVSTVPQLVILSEYKALVFGVAGLMLVGNGVLQWRNRSAPCPLGLSPQQAQACLRTRQMSWRMYGFSVLIFVVGGWFAFVQPWLVR